jgi:hypothetical protein
MWAGLGSAALACVGLYLLARRFVGPFTSAWVAIAFLAVSAFAQRIPVAIFNFVAPYNFSATYGITLAIWSVFLLLHHARSGRPGTLVASAVLAGLVALTKLETTFAVVVAHGAFLVTVLPRPSRTRVLAWGGASPWQRWAISSPHAVGRIRLALAGGALQRGSRFYITRSMGVREVGFSLREILLSVIGWVVLLLAARWLAENPTLPATGGW